MEEEKNGEAEQKKPARFLTVRELVRRRGKVLGLRRISGVRSMDRRITVKDVNRPGLAIAGHMEQFRSERIQIIGQGEEAYCRKEDKRRVRNSLNRMFESGEIPCVIMSGGVNPLPVIRQACQKEGVPLFISSLETSRLITELTGFLEEELAEKNYVHGVLVNVYGLGVLIQGDSGVGKSECALELVKRGHILISDDIIEIRRRLGGWLMGYSPGVLKHHMEVRGLGVIDVEKLFGTGSIMDESYIEMQVRLEAVDSGHLAGYDRTGLQNCTENILGVEIPALRLPVTPGRNLAVLIEVAALSQRLKNMQGLSSAEQAEKKLIRNLRPKPSRKTSRSGSAEKTDKAEEADL
ncbi:MAG: HPr(Ser) kinase/phosphatase [Elusimicrobiales bacterium]|jgi:HPr kinase/phosphorylase|nr:HPr(Ser) kinase/phosphatase [Elusimicrobiales bacterium]